MTKWEYWMANKLRLDLILVRRGLAPTRTAAQGLIMAGKVQSNTRVLDKPGQSFDSEVELQVALGSKYVSRGGDKLASVAEALELSFEGKIILDVGSSTGGFTDYALQHGAIKSYAVDVGTAQLAYKLRQDPRVIVMERMDIRSVAELPDSPEIAVIDVSFISLTKILTFVANLLQPGAPIVAMMKPQFETDKPTADKYHGVIKDEKVRQPIMADFETAIKPEFQIKASADSSVHGAEGNRERFYLLTKH